MRKENFHFIGLGGIGMSALARVLVERGHSVGGSDLSHSPLLEQLEKEGVVVRIGHAAEAVEENVTVVYSTGVKEENVEMQRARSLNVNILHRSDLLHQLMQGKKALVVTGAHGKTTTTGLLASALLEARWDPSFVVGGVLRALGTNARAGSGDYFIAEGDESDGSFLKTAPYGAIVTNFDREHLDYWKSVEKLREGFQTFFQKALMHEHLFWCRDDPHLAALHPPGYSYGFSPTAALHISAFRQTERGISFDLHFRGHHYSHVDLSLFGRHNALNGAAVFGLCLTLGVPEEVIRKAFLNFSGTKRRLEFKGEAHQMSLYDDYGHHPTEIRATLAALRGVVHEKRVVAVFQPHRYTRTRDCFHEWADSFSEADVVILTDIYSAGEEPIPECTSAALYIRMREKLGAKLHYFPRTRLEEGVANLLQMFDVVLTLGAGDITHAGEPILRLFAEQSPKLTVAVLCGGTSAEHAVSLMSARNIAKALDPALFNMKIFAVTKQGEWIVGNGAIDQVGQRISLSKEKLSPAVLLELVSCDVAIPVFHGPEGEDGMMQGLLDALHIPYVGCDYRASAVCMHKGWTKQVALLNNIATAPYLEIDAVTYKKDPAAFLALITERLTFPVWVKAVHLGSSIGVQRAATLDEIPAAIANAFSVDDTLIVEQEIAGRQIEFAVLGNEHVRIAECLEILSHGAFYDYEKKYGPQAMGVEIPAKITDLQKHIGRELAERTYRAVGCKGLSRVDFFLDKEGHFWLNEINPFPGFTATSGYPKMWEASGLTQQKLMNELVLLALHRSRHLAKMRGPA